MRFLNYDVGMRDLADLAVIISVMLIACVLATLMAWPALTWATGGPEWKVILAIVWLIVCYLVCAWAAMRFLDQYRRR